jgi:hypothetical protein
VLPLLSTCLLASAFPYMLCSFPVGACPSPVFDLHLWLGP